MRLTWRCLAALTPPHHTLCDAAGDGPKSDLAARKHTDATKHPTEVRNTPEKP